MLAVIGEKRSCRLVARAVVQKKENKNANKDDFFSFSFSLFGLVNSVFYERVRGGGREGDGGRGRHSSAPTSVFLATNGTVQAQTPARHEGGRVDDLAHSGNDAIYQRNQYADHYHRLR